MHAMHVHKLRKDVQEWMLIIKCNQCLVYKQIDPVHTGRFPTKVVMPALSNWPAGCVVVIFFGSHSWDGCYVPVKVNIQQSPLLAHSCVNINDLKTVLVLFHSSLWSPHTVMWPLLQIPPWSRSQIPTLGIWGKRILGSTCSTCHGTWATHDILWHGHWRLALAWQNIWPTGWLCLNFAVKKLLMHGCSFLVVPALKSLSKFVELYSWI